MLELRQARWVFPYASRYHERALLRAPALSPPSPPQGSPGRFSPQVWWFSDGKPGHLSQVRGLIEALRGCGDFELVEFDCARGTPRAGQRQAMHAALGSLTAPPLILGAGRRTHRPMQRAKRQTRGLAVVLMLPVWPTGQRKGGFDLYVVPKHDGVHAAHNVLLTTGALNPLTAQGAHDPQRGVILIGGPSRRYLWDGPATLERLQRVVQGTPEVTHWAATSSRRTPPPAEAALGGLHPRIHFTPAHQTPPGWVGSALAGAGTAWVTEDSVSMVFEALTAGCRVGLLPLPRARGLGQRFLGWGPGRVASGVAHLVEQGLVTGFDDWAKGTPLPAPNPLAETQRVAASVWERWESHLRTSTA